MSAQENKLKLTSDRNELFQEAGQPSASAVITLHSSKKRHIIRIFAVQRIRYLLVRLVHIICYLSALNYDRLFGTDHRTSALVYYYISDSKDTDDATSNLSAIPLRYQGVSSRFTYGYKDTYLLDVNFGYTGSENFQPGRQYGFFPSVALGWVPTGYKFIQEALPWLDYLKIRASYGSVGNDRITLPY